MYAVDCSPELHCVILAMEVSAVPDQYAAISQRSLVSHLVIFRLQHCPIFLQHCIIYLEIKEIRR